MALAAKSQTAPFAFKQYRRHSRSTVAGVFAAHSTLAVVEHELVAQMHNVEND